jgi:hypothetical protein
MATEITQNAVAITGVGRSQSQSITGQDMNLFPFDAFYFDDINITSSPVLSIKDPWILDVGEISTSSITNFYEEVRTAAETEAILDDIDTINANLQSGYTSWFYDGTPTLLNEPAVNWTDDATKDQHLGDVYYDGLNGKTYHFVSDVPTVYYWKEWTDSGVTLALQNASLAQDTADGKRRVFTGITPQVPYDVGDLWTRDITDGVWVCIVPKTEAQAYSITDWEETTDATNDDSLNNFVDVTYAQFVTDTEAAFIDVLNGTAYLSYHLQKISKDVQNIDEEHQWSMSQITVGQGTIDIRVGAVEEDTQDLAEAFIVLDARVDASEIQIGTNVTGISDNVDDIDTNGGLISTNSGAIITLNSDLTQSNIQIGTNVTGISDNVTDIGTNVTNIGNNSDDIGTNSGLITTNSNSVITLNSTVYDPVTGLAEANINISTNVTAIGDNADLIGDNALAITNKAESSALITLDSQVNDPVTGLPEAHANIALNVTAIGTNVDGIDYHNESFIALGADSNGSLVSIGAAKIVLGASSNLDNVLIDTGTEVQILGTLKVGTKTDNDKFIVNSGGSITCTDLTANGTLTSTLNDQRTVVDSGKITFQDFRNSIWETVGEITTDLGSVIALQINSDHNIIFNNRISVDGSINKTGGYGYRVADGTDILTQGDIYTYFNALLRGVEPYKVPIPGGTRYYCMPVTIIFSVGSVFSGIMQGTSLINTNITFKSNAYSTTFSYNSPSTSNIAEIFY